jgi:hypothetical protein
MLSPPEYSFNVAGAKRSDKVAYWTPSNWTTPSFALLALIWPMAGCDTVVVFGVLMLVLLRYSSFALTVWMSNEKNRQSECDENGDSEPEETWAVQYFASAETRRHCGWVQHFFHVYSTSVPSALSFPLVRP